MKRTKRSDALQCTTQLTHVVALLFGGVPAAETHRRFISSNLVSNVLHVGRCTPSLANITNVGKVKIAMILLGLDACIIIVVI